MNKKEKLIFFWHKHNFYTLNGDYLSRLIKTDNAHKERMLSLIIINTVLFKKCKGGGGGIETHSKTMMVAKW